MNVLGVGTQSLSPDILVGNAVAIGDGDGHISGATVAQIPYINTGVMPSTLQGRKSTTP